MKKYKVSSVALDPRTWRRLGERTEVVTAGEDIFLHCVNGRAVGEVYEFFWNKMSDSPVAVVRVTNVEAV